MAPLLTCYVGCSLPLTTTHHALRPRRRALGGAGWLVLYYPLVYLSERRNVD